MIVRMNKNRVVCFSGYVDEIHYFGLSGCSKHILFLIISDDKQKEVIVSVPIKHVKNGQVKRWHKKYLLTQK